MGEAGRADAVDLVIGLARRAIDLFSVLDDLIIAVPILV
jgi:hypothetical protein